MTVTSDKSTSRTGVIAICGNPNCGKTTIFNAITGLSQQVGNYPGVTVEKVTGKFEDPNDSSRKLTLLDIPGAYSLSGFTPDEYIAASVLFGELDGEPRPDAVICVIDATQVERGLYLLLQILQIGCPVVVALNMVDLARQNNLRINFKRLAHDLGVPVVPVIGNKRKGIEKLKQETVAAIGRTSAAETQIFDRLTESILQQLLDRYGNSYRTRAQYLRILFDENGPAEEKFIADEGTDVVAWIREGRRRLRKEYGSLVIAETQALTRRSEAVFKRCVRQEKAGPSTGSEKIDKYLLHPVLGPIVLISIMVMVFQSIFSWAAPFMDVIDGAFSSLAGLITANFADGPVRSLLADGVIGGVGAVLVFIPQIAILFMFISILEDSGYMPRAAFLVDRMFRWCGLSGKSFIPMLSSFACAIPGILATRTIEDRKLRLITIMVAPLMTCSARLPVYAIMIAAFIPYKSYMGVFNLQGLVLTGLYLLGISAAIIVSFIMKKTVLKTDRGTFMMEMPSYKLPTFRSIGIRVFNRVKSFVLRAGTIILAITIVIWALSYYPRSDEVAGRYDNLRADLVAQHDLTVNEFKTEVEALAAATPVNLDPIADRFARVAGVDDLDLARAEMLDDFPNQAPVVNGYYDLYRLEFSHEAALAQLANERAGQQMRESYLAMVGRRLEPLFEPLGWDWKITVSVLAAFPAREVIIATLGTIYNLGTDVDAESSSLIEKMQLARWEDGPQKGSLVFSPAVALSIMVFFALCCQCGATLVTIRQETSRWIYSAATFTYMTTLAYLSAMVVYRLVSGVGL